MEITKIRIDDIVPYENNVKEHPREQIDQIKKSIVEFGNNDPIAVDEDNVVIEGHGRLYALKELGYTEAECIVLKGLTEEQKDAYRLVHNKLTMNSGFDLQKLEEELRKIKDIDMMNFDFNIADIEAELDKIADEAAEVEEDEFDVDAALEDETIVKRGQIWKLGNHYLMCGDSTSEEDLKELMAVSEDESQRGGVRVDENRPGGNGSALQCRL